LYGIALPDGDGVTQNIGEAAKYFKLSTEQGNPNGHYLYGLALRNGIGVSQNLAEASKYFKISADKNNSHGQYLYGLTLCDRSGAPRNSIPVTKDFRPLDVISVRKSSQRVNFPPHCRIRRKIIEVSNITRPLRSTNSQRSRIGSR
jgi:TPR repeat protein